MEQTHTTPDLTPDAQTALRQHLTQRMLTKVMQLACVIETMDSPTSMQQIAQHCRAISALMGVVHKLIPTRKAAKDDAQDPAEGVLDALLAQLDGDAPDSEAQDNPPPLNRQQRRHAEAMARKQRR